jgi:hypothetical protein
VTDNTRFEELRRRIQKDPASIAFAQLAEEYRRAGNYDEAIAVSRTGLLIHPSYLSARVTLGRALIEVNDLANAQIELGQVLDHAADNLAAIRAMAEIHHRRGELSEALSYYKSALELARHDPDLEQAVEEISRAVTPAIAPAAEPIVRQGLSEQASSEFLSNVFDLLEPEPLVVPPQPMPPARLEEPKPPEQPVPPREIMLTDERVLPEEPTVVDEHFLARTHRPDAQEVPTPVHQMSAARMEAIVNPVLPVLERFLGAIQTYRLRRAV